jgi:hypothetical protein
MRCGERNRVETGEAIAACLRQARIAVDVACEGATGLSRALW